MSILTWVINPKWHHRPENATALTFTKNEREILQTWNLYTDPLASPVAPFQNPEFTPTFSEHTLCFKFVYTRPQQPAPAPYHWAGR